MALPFTIDNQTTCAADALRELLGHGQGCPVDIASAYFSISGWELLSEGLRGVGALRLLLGSEPGSGTDLGLHASQRLLAEINGLAFTDRTVRLVEDLIAFLRVEKVQVRLFQAGFLHAKAYIFHQDRVGPGNYADRLRPFAAMVGSSNFTGPGLTTNKELNLVHRVFTDADEVVDAEAARRVEYLLPVSVAQPPPAVSETANMAPANLWKPNYRRDLPHLQATGRPIFVTFRTSKGFVLPESVRARVLAHCRHDDGQKIILHAAVVMPDHVHLIFTALRDAHGNTYGLAEIMNGIKGASAHGVNKALGRHGQVWQDESFDHILRSHESLGDTIHYIRENPVRKGLVAPGQDYPWLWVQGRVETGGETGEGMGTDTAEGTAKSTAKDTGKDTAEGTAKGTVKDTAEGGCATNATGATGDTNATGGTVAWSARRAIKSEVGARAGMELEQWFDRNWQISSDFKQQLIDLLNKSKFGQHEYTPYQVYLKALFEYLKDQVGGGDPLLWGRSAIDLAEFQEDSVKRARRILQRYDGVLIADSVGLGKTWIGKKLLEGYAYHQRMKALVVCPASLRPMWQRELAESTIAAGVLGMEEMGRDDFDAARYADADVILVDESHNFRSSTANRYLALDDLIQRRGGRGREGARKKIILISATPINNDLYDLLNQIRLFTQNEPDYFQEAGISDIDAYFRQARRKARDGGAAAGELLFNLLDEIVVRNTRPYIRAAYPNATIGGEPVRFPNRQLNTVEYSLEAVYGGVYKQIVEQVEGLSFAPYQLESYKQPQATVDKFEMGREEGLVGISKVRFLKRLESSIAAFRLSVQRALVFEQAYLDFLLTRRVIGSGDFWKMLRVAGLDGEDELGASALAEKLESTEAVKEYLAGVKPVDLNLYDLRRLVHDLERDIAALKKLHVETEPLATHDAKLAKLKELLAGPLRGRKVLIFTGYKDTSRYLFAALAQRDAEWLEMMGRPHIRRIDSGNSPDERTGIVAAFAPKAMGGLPKGIAPIDILISTDVLSEGQNLQDCGILINYDLTWNPVRLVQRSGRIDRLRSGHEQIQVWNVFPEKELEELLHILERLQDRIGQIDGLGMLDASVLGEVVHPRTFNTIRRIANGDVTVLDEEEGRAELAGPEVLLKQLKEMLGKEGSREVVQLPDGIHSGLRRQRVHGMFFYFRAKRPQGEGVRHFWRYIDAKSHVVTDNRFEIAQLISCRLDERRYIGDQDVFDLQERVIQSILGEEGTATVRSKIGAVPDQVQIGLAEDLKAALRRGTVERGGAKQAIQFLGQPAGKAILEQLRKVRADYAEHQDDQRLAAELVGMAQEYLKTDEDKTGLEQARREDLQLVCFEYVSS